MNRIIVFFISLFLSGTVFSQTIDTKKQDFYFGEKQFLFVQADEVNNFFVVDFSKFNSDFEKFYFKDLVFKNKTLSSIDAGINRKTAWFQSAKVYTQAVAETEIEKLINETKRASSVFSEEQKTEMMKKHKK